MKKILYIFPLLFIFLFPYFQGNVLAQEEVENFSTSIVLSVELDRNGGYTQKVSFPTMEKELEIIENKEEYISSLTNKIKTTLFFSYFYTYYSHSIATSKEEYKLGGEKANYTLPTYDDKNKTISFSFSFLDSEAFDIYHPKKEENSPLIQKGFFVDKQVSSAPFLFSQTVGEGEEKTIGTLLVENFSTITQKFSNKKIEDIDFVYSYQHFSHKIHSNADLIIENEKGFLHIWKQSYKDLSKDKKIEVFVYYPNTYVWYSLVLGVAIIVVILGATTYHFVQKKKNSKKTKKES